ncbi:MAG TPA: AAA family ATPase [Galbitalea sp.]
MNILREEVPGTAAHDIDARSVSARPHIDGLLVQVDSTTSTALDSALVASFLSCALPVAASFRIPYSLASLSIAVPGLEVTHQFSGPYTRFVRMAEAGVAEILITQDGSMTDVEILARDHPTASTLWDTIRSRVVDELDDDGMTRCEMWSIGRHGATSHDHTVQASRWVDVRRNYARTTAAQLDELMTLTAPEENGGLVLWHGPPGTGKTSAVRALITEWLPWCDAHVITDPEQFFTSPDYLLDVVEKSPRPDFRAPLRTLDERAPRRWKLIVCEDADEYLRSDARERSGPALGRLLNLTDGLLGEGTRTLVLLTTNDAIGRIHPAVQRPGRCRASIEFPALSVAEAAAWCPAEITPPKSSATLAELFALARGRDVIEPEVGAGLYL